MGSGYYPLERRRGAGRKLAKIAADLHALLDARGPYGTDEELPSAYDNDQYDNAASDGGYETYLELAAELLDRCLEPPGHDSDCATNNMPASPNGPCDCSLAEA